MDLQEKRKLDAEHLAGQLAQVRAKARPWRSLIALALAIAAAVISEMQHLSSFTVSGDTTVKVIAGVCAGGFCVFAAASLIGFSGLIRKTLEPRVGSSHAAVVRYSILLIGSVVIFLVTLGLLRIRVGQLIVGGALTAVLLGIAGQQSMANLFAGIVLLASRPFNVGERIRVRSGAMGGVMEGTVTEIGLTYVRLDTGDGVLALPNSQVLAAAVGPVPSHGPDRQGPA
ncbi:MAG TPA: mechanosensitive ion channel domain-containing protein [Streptosporangiaceae bacterium]|jgi:small-conductance mechanosensitive channel|nr:mechanosensitive ion channel domain-containing protein [Streptosporangiaceae bacterium]